MSMDHEVLESKDVMTRPELPVPISMAKDVQFIQPPVLQRNPPRLLLVVNMIRLIRS